MNASPPPLLACAANRRGAALPVAIFSLIAATVILTGVLLTATTEAALSFAHRDATADLYASEGAIQAYVARQGALPQPVANQPFTAPGSPVPMSITVERVARLAPAMDETDSNTFYSIRAEPQGGGRAVTAMIRVVQSQLEDFTPDLDCALCLGGSGTVEGTAPPGKDWKISNGATSELCSPADSASNAIVYASDATVAINGNTRNQIRGGDTRSVLGREALINSWLGEIAIRDLAWNADIKFGSYFNEPPFTPGQIFTGNANVRYDWGCPGAMDTQRNCSAAGNSNRYKIIAIDGENREVRIDNWHGQGMLIVINGTLRISGQFTYRGLIVAERNVIIDGGGSTPPTIEGAVISAGEVVVDSDELVAQDGSVSAGKAQITFNRCAINAVREAFNGDGTERWGAPKVRGRTFGWIEPVR